jgi:hypothetical protein
MSAFIVCSKSKVVARDKLKVVKSAPQPLCVYTIVHPSVRETWSVAESETPPRGGRADAGRIRRVCV